MYLIASAFFMIFAKYITPENFSDIPLSQMTFRILFKFILALGCATFSVGFFLKSLEKDRIWPWNWTIPYLGNLIIRSAVIFATVAFSHYIINYEKINFNLVFFSTIAAILFIMFSPEFNFFDEKKKDSKEKH